MYAELLTIVKFNLWIRTIYAKPAQQGIFVVICIILYYNRKHSICVFGSDILSIIESLVCMQIVTKFIRSIDYETQRIYAM